MAGRAGDWPRTVAALVTGVAAGIATMMGGALLLYLGERVLASAGFLMALALASLSAGLWVGAPGGALPGHRRMLGRWLFVVVALVMASFVATLWLASPGFQTSALGPPLAVVLLLAEPLYAFGALLAALEARRRGWLGVRWYGLHERGRRAAGVAVPALAGAAVGVVISSTWLIPSFPPGPVLIAVALVMTAVGSLEMALSDGKEVRMSERVVLITGVGGRGQVGYAVARAFVDGGATVVVTGRTQEIEALAKELGDGVVGVAADLTRAADVERLMDTVRQRWARLDALINVAGGLRVMKPLAETDDDEWRRELEGNAMTAFMVTRSALPLLREAKGAVVNFAAPAGLRAMAGIGAYSAGKAGVVALTRALALEEGKNGVRVNAVAPGLVDTETNLASMGGAAESAPAARMVTRAQVADVVVFLASDAASGVTGEVIQVLGGRVS